MLWDAVRAGKCMAGKVPFGRWDVDACAAANPTWSDEVKARLQWGAFVEELELFDPGFFRLSTAEAAAMDPQHRLLLEYSWLALADAGHTKEGLQGQRVGVFVGIAGGDANPTSEGAYRVSTLPSAAPGQPEPSAEAGQPKPEPGRSRTTKSQSHAEARELVPPTSPSQDSSRILLVEID